MQRYHDPQRLGVSVRQLWPFHEDDHRHDHVQQVLLVLYHRHRNLLYDVRQQRRVRDDHGHCIPVCIKNTRIVNQNMSREVQNFRRRKRMLAEEMKAYLQCCSRRCEDERAESMQLLWKD